MPWPGIKLNIALFLLIATVGPPGVITEGNVGCLFSDRLCLDDEWCFDDYAFGRCTPSGDVDEEDIFRFDLKREESHELKRELQRLFALGYRWSHGYTQCRLQAMLYAMKHDIPFKDDACSHLVDQDLEGALKSMDVQDPMDPREVAIIKYTPNVEEINGKYADEIYYPPSRMNAATDSLRNKILGSNPVDILDMPDPYAGYEIVKRQWIPQMHRRTPPIITIKSMRDFNDDDFLDFLPPPPEPIENIEYDDPPLTYEEMKEIYPLIKFLDEKQLTPDDLSQILSPESYQQLERLLKQFEENVLEHKYLINDLYEEEEEEDGFEESNQPIRSRENYETTNKLDYLKPKIFSENLKNPTTDKIFKELKHAHARNDEVFRKIQERKQQEKHHGVYTEGGVVYPSESKSIKDLKLKNFINGDLLSYLPSMKKKGPRGPHPNPHKLDLYDMEEFKADSIFVGFNKDFQTWRQGKEIIRNISDILHLERNTFDNGHVIRNVVIFKVLPNSQGLNATEIVKKIVELKEEIADKTGLKIIGAGIKDQAKMQEVLAAPMINDNEFYFVIFMVCGVLGAMIVAAAIMILVRRHLKLKEKLQGLAKPDTEASKDYQDLCRARMSVKGQQHPGATNENIHDRITSLSKESEQSPSSRSSTSSWSEEPALHNMDISTGHIVLNYMEDHLRNKDRLEQEWVALCAYVAEPCAVTVAVKGKNVEKNRYPDVLPYDHARVVLNQLCNENASDYINASSITDHDPRNPAYIATQGPLPNTSADFWQLIWEQGAVVIVMLTRLTENGSAMCHRYWPEEGSELYHHYEVHLVSEHIWCDDYLVRSFYLKNTKTNETRTVTQFHFLSWPEIGVPASTKALLEFRRKVNKSYRGRSCPIVVHCSDGAGRTGTYCLIDMVLSRMAKGAKEIDIAATLEHLRDQRVKMVATKQQFEFVLTAVAEEVHAILKVLPTAQQEK